MGEIRTLCPEGQLSVTDLKREAAKNISLPVEAVLEEKTANEWIEEAKINQFHYHYSTV